MAAESRFTAFDVLAARQELARRSVQDFACMVDIPTVPLTEADDEDRFQTLRIRSLATHHALLLEALQGIEDGSVPNLMVLMPPGSAKSTYVDIVFVPWFMAKKARRNVILASYASDIAKRQGRRAQQLIRSRSFMSLMNVTLDRRLTAADEWAMTNGSEYLAGGLLSGLVGNRSSLGILDDPISGRTAAESQRVRDQTWDAYVDDFCSRLIPGAPQVMILTRWHEDDPAGRILPAGWDGESGWFNGRDGREWLVLCIPAIADRIDDPLGRAVGESLWPEWFKPGHWEPFQKNARSWSSLYQQKPSPADGTFFKRDWFKRYRPEDLPAKLNYYMTSDHAPGGKQDSDFNVLRVWGVDHRNHLWLVDGYRVQGTIDKAMGVRIDETTGDQSVALQGALPLIQKWKPFCWFPENDNNWRSAEPFVVAAMRQHRIHCRIEPLPTGGDKATKAQPFQAKAAMGEVHFPIGLDGDEIIAEYLKFPAGRNDDEVDAAAHIGRALDMAHPAIVPPTEKTQPRDGYERNRATATNWKAQ